VAKVTIQTLQKMKEQGEKIAVLTAYDFSFARIFDAAGVDVLLVGDSLGMVVQGLPSTLGVTLDQMVYHTRAVARGAARAHVVADLPFGSYQASTDQAVQNGIRLLAEGGAEAVKLEGGSNFTNVVEALNRASVPVMGHLGLTPQSIHQFGGFVVQGRGEAKANILLEDARALQEAGCYAIVLEAIPAELAAEVTAQLRIPTIGIGAGVRCDGQVLVSYDLLGMNPEFHPRFVKRYAELHALIAESAALYSREVRSGVFPTDAHSFGELRLVDAAAGNAGKSDTKTG
jgi:3-methyl-2-oxobutanoate hydroxymethyltransferase